MTNTDLATQLVFLTGRVEELEETLEKITAVLHEYTEAMDFKLREVDAHLAALQAKGARG